MATKLKDLKKGSILCEFAYSTVLEVGKKETVIVDEASGKKISITNSYVEDLLCAADTYVTESPKNKTELADLFLSNTRIVMTVCFTTAEKKKTNKAYEAEKAAKIAEINRAGATAKAKLINDLIDNPILRVTPGELRVIKGRHYGQMNDLGRINFIDMEADKGTGPHDGRLRQVDPRTIEYLIFNNIKYVLK